MTKQDDPLHQSPVRSQVGKRILICICTAVAVTCTGCAEPSRYVPSHVTGPETVQHASMPMGTPAVPVTSERFTPFRHALDMEDDPTEPYSPNYGNVPLNPDGSVPDGKDYDPNFDRTYHAQALPNVKEIPEPPEQNPVSRSQSRAKASLDPDSIVARAKERHGWRIW